LHLGIDYLDQILEIFRRPLQPPPKQPRPSPQAVSDDEYYHDVLTTPSRPGSRHETRLKARIIQLTSSRSVTGKTNLLYHLSATSVLPGSHSGNEAAVVWFDTDGRFSALRLAQVASTLLPAGTGKEENDRIVKEALSHVHVFKPQSAAQLIETLKVLPDHLLSRTLHHSQQRALGLIVLDSATAFYWADRADAEIARLSDPGAPLPMSMSSSVIGQLRELEKSFSCTVLFSTDATLQRKSHTKSDTNIRTVADSPLPPQHDQVFQDPWKFFATLTLDVHRVPVPQFTPAMTVEECARDQPRRIEAVKRGRHRAQVVWTGDESNEVREGIRSLKNGEGFTFRITDIGVDLE
jgi:Rad51